MTDEAKLIELDRKVCSLKGETMALRYMLGRAIVHLASHGQQDATDFLLRVAADFDSLRPYRDERDSIRASVESPETTAITAEFLDQCILEVVETITPRSEGRPLRSSERLMTQ